MKNWSRAYTCRHGHGILASPVRGVLLGTALALGGLSVNAAGVSAKANYLPPANPPANIAANPNFFGTPACWNGYAEVGTQTPTCTSAELEAVNNAQRQLGEPTITLPTNWQQLSNPERLFVFISLERISLGLPPYVGMSTRLDSAAQQAANQYVDPSVPPGWPVAYSHGSWGTAMFGGAWSGGWHGMGSLAADYGWLYSDGWGGPSGTTNLACTSATSSGCWAHRDELLGETTFGSSAGQPWGVGLNCSVCVVGAGSADNDASTTVLVAKPSVPDSELHLTFTWASERPYLGGGGTPPATRPVVSAVSPNSGLTAGGTTVTIKGSDFSTGADATSVSFGATPATAVSCTSTTTCTAVSPAGSVGTVNITVKVGSTVSQSVAADRFTYISDTSSTYTAMAPTRLLDTRTTGGPLGPGRAVSVTVAGVDGVPLAATAVALNLTATNTTTASYMTAFPAGSIRPTISSLNWTAGETVPGLVIVPVGTNGQVEIYNYAGDANLIVDLEGYFAPKSGSTSVGSYVPLTPARITDTRPNSGEPNAGDTLGSGSTLDVQVTGEGGVPSAGVAAVVANVTVTGTTAASYLTVAPEGTSRPLASNLNWVAGQTVANRVVVPVGPTGQIAIYNDLGTANVIVDVTGYFTASATAPANATLYTPISPVRVLDTRQTGQRLGPQATLGQQIAGVDGISASATAVVTTITASGTTANSYFTVYPGGTRPTVSDVNWRAGQIAANLTLATLGPTGGLAVYNNSGNANLIVDVLGYFTPK